VLPRQLLCHACLYLLQEPRRSRAFFRASQQFLPMPLRAASFRFGQARFRPQLLGNDMFESHAASEAATLHEYRVAFSPETRARFSRARPPLCRCHRHTLAIFDDCVEAADVLMLLRSKIFWHFSMGASSRGACRRSAGSRLSGQDFRESVPPHRLSRTAPRAAAHGRGFARPDRDDFTAVTAATIF